MEVKTIYKDRKTEVKAVWVQGKYFYTRTYFLDDKGYVEKQVTVWWNGEVNID